MGKYFGTDGFRGEANKDLNFEHAVKIGRFLGWYYGANQGKKAKIVIGKDTRRSSYMFEYALCTGLMASGADAYIMHVTTTPSVAYITRVDDFDCGIMISASHNPYYDNGIKLFNGNGEKMDEETILKVEDYIDGKLEIPVAEETVSDVPWIMLRDVTVISDILSLIPSTDSRMSRSVSMLQTVRHGRSPREFLMLSEPRPMS